MIYSSACEYGIRAATHLAGRFSEGWVKLHEIAEQEDIPGPFLSSVLQRLVARGLLRSARGPTGGYALARDPRDVALQEIVEAVDGLGSLEECAVGLGMCSEEQPCPLHETWKPIRQEIKRYLRETTLEQLAIAIEAKRAMAVRADGKP